LPRPAKHTVFSKKEVGGRIRTLRQARGLTQVDLAETLEITQSNLSAIERGARGLTVHQVVKLARALRATTDEILSPAKAKAAAKGDQDALKDRRFLRRLQKVDQLPERDQQALLRTLDAFLGKV
jgi:transcriptional regulator with XRE-family HTH domain